MNTLLIIIHYACDLQIMNTILHYSKHNCRWDHGTEELIRVKYAEIAGIAEMEESGDNESGCPDYDTEEFRAIAAVNSALGGVSFFACLLVIGLIFLFKKYRFFNQRLILYLTIAAALNTLSMLTEATVYYPQTEAFEIYCYVSAYFHQVAGWAQVLAVTCITIELLLKVFFKIQTNQLLLEIIFIIVTFVIPLSFNWVPFINNTFGKSGPWCWIRSQNENCTEDIMGKILSMTLWYATVYPLLIILSLAYVTVLISIWYQKYRYEGVFDPERQIRRNMMLSEVRPLLWYPLIFLLIELFPLMNRLYELFSQNRNTTFFWWMHAIVVPLEGGVIALVYALDPETRRRLRWSIIKMYLIECFTRKGNIDDYDFESNGMTDSLLSDTKSLSTTRPFTQNANPHYGTKL